MPEKLTRVPSFKRADLRRVSNRDLYDAGITAMVQRDTATSLTALSYTIAVTGLMTGIGFDNLDAAPETVTTVLKGVAAIFGIGIASEELIRAGVNHVRLRKVQRELKSRGLRATTNELSVKALPHGLDGLSTTPPLVPAIV